MKLPVYLGLIQQAEATLADAFEQLATGHAAEPDVHFLCLTLAKQCRSHEAALQPAVDRYGAVRSEDEPERLHAQGLEAVRSGPLGLLRDLQDVYLLASFVDVTWTMIRQASQALRDAELIDIVGRCDGQTTVQLDWLRTRMKQAAPQALVASTGKLP